MAESTNNNEQRQCSGFVSSNSNNINAAGRKKVNNGSDLSASPKYNKSNGRKIQKENTQSKKLRRNGNNNNQKEQRNNSNYQANNRNNIAQHENDHSRSQGVLQGSSANIDEEDFEDDLNGFSYGVEQQLTNSKVYHHGRHKKTFSHLLNFDYNEKQRSNGRSYHSHGRWGSSGYWSNRQVFSKEQFLQANCQFVVQKGSIDYSPHFADPDLAIDWDRVEKVFLHSMQPLKCPICLSEPRAGKITRCGHVYCYSCLLHYLALSDKAWRKCPVCAESIYKKDLRSVRGVISHPLKVGDSIHFRLMCRERGSALCYPRKIWEIHGSKIQSEKFLTDMNKEIYAHLLFADDETILRDIVEQENIELLKQLQDDEDQPESCFIRQALEENNERAEILRNRIIAHKRWNRSTSTKQENDVEINLVPPEMRIVYENSFENITREKDPNSSATLAEHKIQNEEDLTTDTMKSETEVIRASSSQVYFYQADEIYHAYMSGINTRILLHEFGSYNKCPDELYARIEAIESHFMTEELRLQFRALNHLPLTCEFQVIEIRLHSPIISSPTMEFFAEEIHRRRQQRIRKERMETRRQQRAELFENQKLFSQYPPEMMYIPQQSFPINGTESMEEFPAITSTTASSSPPSASIQLPDDNSSPLTGVSFAQMLKQQAPPNNKSTATAASKSVINKSASIDISSKSNKSKKNIDHSGSEQDDIDQDTEYYSSVPNLRSNFSLEEVFDRLKLVNDTESSPSAANQATGNGTSRKKNKKNKQILFSTGLGGQAKL